MVNTKKNDILSISEEDVAYIMGDAFRYFPAIINGVYCNCCKSTHTSVLTNYRIYLDAKNDVIINGYCDKCQQPIRRRVETGEKPYAQERATITRLIKVELLGK